MARVAFLGIGNMGSGMAGRLLDAGHQLTVFNRTRDRTHELERNGARVAETPAAAVDNADIIFSMVGDDDASRAIWTGNRGVFAGSAGTASVAIECSTISHRWTLELSGIAAREGLRFLDCPVTGLPDAAAAGTLGMFVGGPAETLKAVRPVLDTMSTSIVHFGPVGSGIAYKLMINLMGAVQIAAAAEGLLIAEKAGLDPQTVVDTIPHGQAASPQVVRNTRRMVEGNHETDVVFAGHWRLKDTAYGLEFARSLGIDAAFGEVAGRIYRDLVDAGHGDLNETKVIDALRERMS